jgi:transposase
LSGGGVMVRFDRTVSEAHLACII